MTLFASKLNGFPIGITVGKMFVADKSAILSVSLLSSFESSNIWIMCYI